jgi:hypothetical protein
MTNLVMGRSGSKLAGLIAVWDSEQITNTAAARVDGRRFGRPWLHWRVFSGSEKSRELRGIKGARGG